MRTQLLAYLADPNDGQPLDLHTFEGSEDETREGVLLNPQSGRWYPVHEGIPTLFADALRQSGLLEQSDDLWVQRFGERMKTLGCRIEDAELSGAAPGGDMARIEGERQARDEQAEDYDRLLSLKMLEWFEVPAYRQALNHDLQTPLFEAGCGTGRFTGLFAELAPEVVAVDMSRSSIVRNRVRHAGKTAATVHYVHADLTHLPLREGVFGRIAHCGVYEHIPSRGMREQFLGHAHRVLAADGTLLLSAYRYGGLTKMFEKEGEHAGGIPFTRFTAEELRAEVESRFRVEKFVANLGIYMSMIVARPLG